MTKETREEIVEFLEWNKSGKWPHDDVLLDTEECNEREADCVCADVDFAWWEALRAPEVAKGQQKHRVDWDATDGRNGGAQRTVWAILMEMERFKYRAGDEDLGVAPGAGPREGLRVGQSSCGLGVGDAFQLRKEDLEGVLWDFFEHQRRVQFEGCVAKPLRTITAILPGSKWSCLLRIVLQDALSEVTNIYPPLKLRVFVDDISALLMGKNKVVAEMAEKVMKRRREEVEEKGLKLSITGNGEKEQDDCVVWFLGRRAASMQQRRRSDLG